MGGEKLMSEIILPRWDGRFEATRDGHNDFTDAAMLMLSHFRFYETLYNVIAPYEARQRQSDIEVGEDEEFNYENYVPPTVEFLRNTVHRGSMPDVVYNAVLEATVKFCANNRGKFAMPVPHPTTLHSIQLPKGAFLIKKGEGRVSEIHILGMKRPILIEGLRNPGRVQHLVVRPKSSASGVADLKKWEVLTFEEYQGYIPLWVDSTANPRFAGMV